VGTKWFLLLSQEGTLGFFSFWVCDIIGLRPTHTVNQTKRQQQQQQQQQQQRGILLGKWTHREEGGRALVSMNFIVC